MKVKFNSPRHVVGVGFFNDGDVRILDETLARQLIGQGVAEEVADKPKRAHLEPKPTEEKEDE